MTRTVAAVVLAAGRSQRMGGINKLLSPVDGSPMIVRVVDAALESRADPVFVVTGFERQRIREALDHRPVTVIHNAEFAAGLSTSLRRGVEAAAAVADGVLVCLGDMPRVGATYMDRLIATFISDDACDVCVPVFDGRRGNPVLWHRRFFPQLTSLQGDQGARSLLKTHAEAVCTVEMEDGAILADVDTPADMEDLLSGRKETAAPPMHEAIAYHEEILSFADARTGHGRLDRPDATATADNPYCGDRVSMDVTLDHGVVTGLAHRVRGCVLCEAAASIVGAHGPGETTDAMAAITILLKDMLQSDGGAQANSLLAGPSFGPWVDLGVFAPVRAYKSRHDCVLLPFRALLTAVGREGVIG